MIQPLYPPLTSVWLMNNNKPCIYTIYSAQAFPLHNGKPEVQWSYLCWKGDNLVGVDELKCREMDEIDVFPTKADLIDSL